MKKTNFTFLKIVVYSGITFLLAISCSPGINQDPVTGSVTIYQPFHNSNLVLNGSTQSELIGIRATIEVLTFNNNNDIVSYPNSPYNIPYPHEPSSNRTHPIIQNIAQPKGATRMGTIIDVQTRLGCAWPIPGQNYPSTIGGEGHRRFVSSISTYPHFITASAADFNHQFAECCIDPVTEKPCDQ